MEINIGNIRTKENKCHLFDRKENNSGQEVKHITQGRENSRVLGLCRLAEKERKENVVWTCKGESVSVSSEINIYIHVHILFPLTYMFIGTENILK